jgi:cell shape-determining protein MreC
MEMFEKQSLIENLTHELIALRSQTKKSESLEQENEQLKTKIEQMK